MPVLQLAAAPGVQAGSELLAVTRPEHVPLELGHVNLVSEHTYVGAVHATVASV